MISDRFRSLSVALTLNAIPALIVLYFTGYFNLPLSDTGILYSTGHAALLGVFGYSSSLHHFLCPDQTGRCSFLFHGDLWYTHCGKFLGNYLWRRSWAGNNSAAWLLILTGVYLANRKGPDNLIHFTEIDILFTQKILLSCLHEHKYLHVKMGYLIFYFSFHY